MTEGFQLFSLQGTKQSRSCRRLFNNSHKITAYILIIAILFTLVLPFSVSYAAGVGTKLEDLADGDYVKGPNGTTDLSLSQKIGGIGATSVLSRTSFSTNESWTSIENTTSKGWVSDRYGKNMYSFVVKSYIPSKTQAESYPLSVRDNDTSWWTSTYKNFSTPYYYSWVIASDGSSIGIRYDMTNYQTRAVHILKSGLEVTSGSGTAGDPYILTSSNVKLVQGVNIGNYVKGQDGINDLPVSQYLGNNTVLIRNNFNSEQYNLTRDAGFGGRWHQGYSLATESYIPNYDEVSGYTQATIRGNNTIWYASSKQGAGQPWVTEENGNFTYYNIDTLVYGIRPVLQLQSGLVKLNGTGTSVDPYIVGADITPPILTITSTPASPTNADSVTYTFQFTEAVTGFTASDITVTNGTRNDGTFVAVDGDTYTIDVTKVADGNQVVTVAAGACQDTAANLNEEGTVTVIMTTIATSPGYSLGTVKGDRKWFKYYIGLDANNISRVMLVAPKDVNGVKQGTFIRDEILNPATHQFISGSVYYIDREGKIQLYN
ncbi:MAG: hypothetical protein A2Y22_03825 [Clostridiales bacterium GWD2_32_59]|nr:MAG: hypothetical protein A2Y22_03825 [Clostridiales bacterium GWD2_32_59]